MLTSRPVQSHTLPIARRCVELPAGEPVSLEEVTEHCRATEDDATWLATAITRARELIESETRRVLLRQVWDIIWDDPPARLCELWPCPVISVDGIYLTDVSRVEGGSIDPSTYRVDTVSIPARLELAPGCTWDETDTFASFRVRLTAGYGVRSSDVPAMLRGAMCEAIGTWYRYREGTNKLPDAVLEMIQPYKVHLHRGG